MTNDYRFENGVVEGHLMSKRHFVQDIGDTCFYNGHIFIEYDNTSLVYNAWDLVLTLLALNFVRKLVQQQGTFDEMNDYPETAQNQEEGGSFQSVAALTNMGTGKAEPEQGEQQRMKTTHNFVRKRNLKLVW